MLISFDYLIRRHRLKITGFIQAGAHFAEELEDFKKCFTEKPGEIYLFEPLPEAFKVLETKKSEHIHIYSCALGATEATATMYVDKENTGQSSSILKPALHLEQYPDITFPTQIQVKVKPLDSFKIKGCNALWMDVQGYELEVLKGARKTLEGIDYVYTEVNVDEVYEDCARLHDLDKYLGSFGFERVELNLSGKTWGDALYIKKKLIAGNQYLNVPYEFKQKLQLTYPPDNTIIFEEWFSDCVDSSCFDNLSNYVYIPVFWTGYYCNNSYGKDAVKNKKLQNFLDSLSNKVKYFTIVQYDDGILQDFRDKNVVVFSMGGGSAKGRNVKVVPIPLLGVQHEWNFDEIKKDIICNFVGRAQNHPVRKKMEDYLFKKPDFFFHFNLDIREYCFTLARSFFTLAPRGYGLTSFRIWEALQYKSVPVYVTEDKPFLPEFYDHENKPCMIICKPEDAEALIRQMLVKREVYNQFIANGQYYFEKYFDYNGLSNYILDYLSELNTKK